MRTDIFSHHSIFGRIGPAWWADHIGRFNVMIIMAGVTTIFVFALWIPARSNAALVLFAILFGFTSGTIVSMAPPIVAQMSDVRQIGIRTGTVFTFVAIAVLAGNPIAGALIVADNGSYVKCQIFAGCVMAGGSVFFVLARVKLAGSSMRTKV
jgi:MFS family permease